MRRLLAGVLVIAGMGMAQANAADLDCSLISRQAEGVLASVKGDVLATGANGYVNAAPGMAVAEGSKVVTGANGSATLKFDGRTLKVGPNSTVNISRIKNNGVCVRVARGQAAPGNAGASSSGIFGSNSAAMGLGIIALGGGAAVAIAASDSGASD